MDEEELAWDVVRDRINIDVEAGEFTELEKIDSNAPIGSPGYGNEEEQQQGVQLLDLDDQQAGPSTQKIPRRGAGRPRASNPILDNLLGQANLEHARGRTKEAMAYLFEAVKLAPFHMQTYKELSDLYEELGQQEKSFEFRMLAALLNNRASAEEWNEIAELARHFNRLELVVACLAKAIRADPENWEYYEKRIQVLDTIGDLDLAMKTRLQAAQSINCQTYPVSFAWIDKLIKTAADYYCTLKDEERATEALETFILRSREFGCPIDFEHLALLGMWMGKGKFEEAAKSILALHEDRVQAVHADGSHAMMITHTNTGYVFHPWPPGQPGMPEIHWNVQEELNTLLLAQLVICWVQLGQAHLVPELVDQLLRRPVGRDEEGAFLDVARSLHGAQQMQMALDYMERLRTSLPMFQDSADAWFLSGCLYQALGRLEEARTAYETVISSQPGHVDARINLSTILQQLDQPEQALETLKDLDLDSCCAHIPDERLLVRQADVLLQQRKMDQYISCLRTLLIPHFYQIHTAPDLLTYKRSEKIPHSTLRKCAMDAIKGSPLERMVKRLGYIAAVAQRPLDELRPNELHDYAFKLAEALFFAGEYEDMLHVVCYAFLHPQINQFGFRIFINLLFFSAIKARCNPLAFEFLRFHLTYTMPKLAKEKDGASQQQLMMGRVYTAMNYIFCQHQSVNYHRFIMRQLVKQPDSDTLHTISGNNSLVTGAYRHALGEYFTVYLRNKHDPLLALLIALTFAHISCKKDISSRHMVALRAFAFMNKYATLRSAALSQEVQYNMGRMFHQMGMFGNALRCYERVLYECPTPLCWVEDPKTGHMHAERAERYDLRRQAGYNLALIYDASGNRLMARHILEQFCTI